MRLRDLFLTAAAAALVAPGAGAATAYAIGDGGASLLRFETDNPGAVTRVGSFGGDASFLDGIDFRPADGRLYGYLDSTDSIYTVDLETAAVSFVSTSTAPTNTFVLGIDFNPVPDRLRIVTESQQNLRVNVDTGAAIVDGTLTYAAGDPNAGSLATLIVEAAYTNSDTNPATGTQLYYIDYGLDILVTTSAPNGGVLNTVGSLGVDTSELVGFDIFTFGGVNTAYAVLNVGGSPGFYSIDLATGAATSIGSLDPGLGPIYGLSVVVPEPSTLALVAVGGLAGLVVARRRRRAALSARA